MSRSVWDPESVRERQARAQEADRISHDPEHADTNESALVQTTHDRKARSMTENPHFVKVGPADPDSDGWRDRPTVTFECRGDRTSKCHQYPDCDCESWDDTHEHPYVSHDECWMQGWFDNDGHSYEGPDSNDMDDCGVPRDMAAEGKITAQYEDGYVSWDFAA